MNGTISCNNNDALISLTGKYPQWVSYIPTGECLTNSNLNANPIGNVDYDYLSDNIAMCPSGISSVIYSNLNSTSNSLIDLQFKCLDGTFSKPLSNKTSLIVNNNALTKTFDCPNGTVLNSVSGLSLSDGINYGAMSFSCTKPPTTQQLTSNDEIIPSNTFSNTSSNTSSNAFLQEANSQSTTSYYTYILIPIIIFIVMIVIYFIYIKYTILKK